MKTLIKLILSIYMPSFGIALIIRRMIRNSENENKILTRKKIQRMYYGSTLILLFPLILLIAPITSKDIMALYLSYGYIFGIIVAVVFIFTTKDLKVEPNNQNLES